MSENTLVLTCDCGCEVLKVSSRSPVEIDVRGAMSIQCRECRESKIYIVGSGRLTDKQGTVSIIA